MNLETTIELQAGGPGSGCHGETCGRPATGKLQLVKKASNDEVSGITKDWYHIKNAEGERVGTAEVHRDGDTLIVDWASGLPDFSTDYGHRLPEGVNVKDLLRQLKMFYPGITKVAGRRVTGTRKDKPKERQWTTVAIHASQTRLEGFSNWQQEHIRAILSRIPLQLQTNFKAIVADASLGAKHGRYDETSHVIRLNPRDFHNQIKFGHGPGRKLDHVELTLAHEVGHSVFMRLSKAEQDQWKKLSGWQVGSGPDQAAPYREKRPGWPREVATETHSKDAKFTRRYGERNEFEDFADAFGFFVMGQKDRVPVEKRQFLERMFKKQKPRVQ